MKRLFPILALLLFCPLAFGQGQSVGTVSFSSTVGGNAVAPSMTNTAGNFLFSYAFVSCATSSAGSAITIPSNHDSNGNLWNISVDSTFTFSNPHKAMYFSWTQASINGGANVVTYNNSAVDCRIEGGIQVEYAGLVAWNPGSFRINGNFMPLATPDSNTTFPIDANATYGPPSNTSNNLVFTCAVHEGASTGTWSGSTGLTQVNSMTSTNFQMACFDGTATTVGTGGPASLQIGNTSGTVTLALGEWDVFNRTSAPAGSPVSSGCGGPTATCTIFPAAGSYLIASYVENGPASFTSNTCGTLVNEQAGNIPGGTFGAVMIVSTNAGPCTIARTSSSLDPRVTMIITVWPPGTIVTDGAQVAFQYANQTDVSFAGSSPLALYTSIADPYSTILYSVGFSKGGGLPGFSCTNGSVAQATIVNNLTVAACLASGLSPGAQPNTMTWTNGNNQVQYYEVLLRTTAPSFGHIQSVVCDSTVCQLPFPPTPTDQYIVTLPCGDKVHCVLTNNNSLAELFQPGVNTFSNTYRVPSIGSTPTQFTCTGFGCFNMVITEVRGLASGESLYDSAVNYDYKCNFGGGCTDTSWSSTPIHIVRGGEYYLQSSIFGIEQNLTSSSGFIPRIYDVSCGTCITSIVDMIVNPSAPMDYTNIPSWATGVTAPSVSLRAWGAVSSATTPHVWQTQVFSATSSPIVGIMLNPTTAGNSLLIGYEGGCGASGSGHTFSLANTFGGTVNLARGGGTSDIFAIWAINGITNTSGTYTITTNCVGSRGSIIGAEVGPVENIQAGNSNTTLTTSITTGSATCSSTCFFGSWLGGGTDLITSYVYNTDPSWTYIQNGYQDNVGLFFYGKTDLSGGTESNFGTLGGGVQSFGAIVPLGLNPITPTAVPFVNLITKNDPSRYLGEWRK